MNVGQVIGADELIEKLAQLGQRISERELQQALMAGGYVLEAGIKADMAAEKSGRFYGSHRASAPGETPAVDTSNLINSIMTEDAGGNQVFVGTNAEYAEPLEFGTARMAARPFLRPGAEKNREAITAAVQTILKRSLE